MTDKIDSLDLESLRAGVVRVTVVLKAIPGIAKGSSASKRIASREAWPADRCGWQID